MKNSKGSQQLNQDNETTEAKHRKVEDAEAGKCRKVLGLQDSSNFQPKNHQKFFVTLQSDSLLFLNFSLLTGLPKPTHHESNTCQLPTLPKTVA